MSAARPREGGPAGGEGGSGSPGRFPHLVLRGSPHERGLAYGRLARDRIHESVAVYRDVFLRLAALEWPDAVAQALKYESYIAEFAPDALAEIAGIAEGAGLTRGDVLALNARSELMFSKSMEAASADGGECTSLAVLPEASAHGGVMVGQNWDWIPRAQDTAVLLEVHRDDLPSYVTIAEAGHLAKVGVNSAGLGVCTNTLVSSRDRGRNGLPYHIILRALLDAQTISAATRTIYAATRAFSGNFLLAHRDGLAVNIESTSGGVDGVHASFTNDGILTHTNHFTSDDLKTWDVRVSVNPGTLFRMDSVRRTLRAGREGGVTLELIQAALRDHRNAPESVCWHPDPARPPADRRSTIASVIMDLVHDKLHVTAGPPCQSPYYTLDLRELFQGTQQAEKPTTTATA